MTRAGDAARLTGDTATAVLKQVPIVRGWGNRPNQAKDWMVVGTGILLWKVDEFGTQVEPGDIDAQWEAWGQHLSPDFVKYVQTKEFVRFKCPRCEAHI